MMNLCAASRRLWATNAGEERRSEKRRLSADFTERMFEQARATLAEPAGASCPLGSATRIPDLEVSIRVATTLRIPRRPGLLAGDGVLDADRRRQLLVLPSRVFGVVLGCHLVLPSTMVTGLVEQ